VHRGADEVYAIQDPRLAHFTCETYSNVLTHLIKTYRPTIILAAATSMGRTLMPHVAVRTHAGLTADCTELDIEPGTGNLLQTRPAIGGNIMATIKTPDHRPQMATVRPKSSRPLPADPDRSGKVIEVPLDRALVDERVRVVGYRRDAEDFVNLEEADVVIAGGRGMKKAENFALLRGLADELGGMVGASRDAIDRGWLGYPHQIGLSGKTISPRLSSPPASPAPSSSWPASRPARPSSASTATPTPASTRSPTSASSATCSRCCPSCSGGSTSGRASTPPDRREPDELPTRHPRDPRALRAIVGEKSVLVDAERIEAYAHDETSASEYAHAPDVVVLPTTTEQVAAIVGSPTANASPSPPAAPAAASPAAPSPSTAASCSPSRR
jgi:hypothetical protein